MESYVKMLLEEIRKAHRAHSEELIGSESVEDKFSDIERFVSGDAEQPLGYYCGLSLERFPPPERVSDEQKLKICLALDEMLESWNTVVDIPSEVPPPMRYRLLVNKLRDPFTPMRYGTFVFDFCTGCSEGCELEDYCRCID